MAKVSMIGMITCQDGKADGMAAVLTRMVTAASDEPVAEICSYHRVADDSFAFFALMTDESAMQQHG